MSLLIPGVAGAESKDGEVSASEAGAAQQEPAPRAETGDLVKAGSELEGTQDTSGDPKNQQEEGAENTQAKSEERGGTTTHRGENLRDASLALKGALTNRDDTVRFRQDVQRALEETRRRLDQGEKEYKETQEDKQARTDGLSEQRAKLEDPVTWSEPKEKQMEARISRLKVAERSGKLSLPPASGSESAGSVQPARKERELEIARQDIVAEPVKPIPYKRYVQLYKAAAKRYGFAKDWYVLAAVGKVESNHGENMGPSSAGAMGPMQFLPSTWSEYGVDGNGDGVANILDPEDAIPAAARYLKAGGAPGDWYAALYTYNRAGWYVREVLGFAERYRRLANDNTARPYI